MKELPQQFSLKQKKIIPGFWAENSKEWDLLLDSRFFRVASDEIRAYGDRWSLQESEGRKLGMTGPQHSPQLAGPVLCRHCWLSPLSGASFAPAMKCFKRKHTLTPYGKGQGFGGEQVLAQETPEWQQKVTSPALESSLLLQQPR